MKDALTKILVNISNVDTLIASLPSDSSPTTPFISGDNKHIAESLNHLRKKCEDYVLSGWAVMADLTHKITDPHKSSFQTIILDDPSFADLILNSLPFTHKDIRRRTIMAITNIVNVYPSMKEQFITTNLVGRMFEIVDFVSLPLSESKTHFAITRFHSSICRPTAETREAQFEQYRLIRVSVFQPAKHFIIFLFNNWDKLILNEEDTVELEKLLCNIHCRIKNMELRSDEHETDIVSELVKWEVRTMIEMEYEKHYINISLSIGNRTQEWNRNKRERQKRREVLLREDGWDDALELRVVGIEVDTDQTLRHHARLFRKELTFNAD
ncbi:hypothetical protein BLNAU_12435 [Blattamonas nauphoetae]|uniref:Uncharacterized protein n=1 Tax=Blattamonas nauphoetae TaxID=2049346 RepID=A0ABQ9XMI8_9EUKA|nr:hypothetical protein BLNAU_12435 [Blattamonas nauphoetae]